jgi:hypothetical protein
MFLFPSSIRCCRSNKIPLVCDPRPWPFRKLEIRLTSYKCTKILNATGKFSGVLLLWSWLMLSISQRFLKSIWYFYGQSHKESVRLMLSLGYCYSLASKWSMKWLLRNSAIKSEVFRGKSDSGLRSKLKQSYLSPKMSFVVATKTGWFKTVCQKKNRINVYGSRQTFHGNRDRWLCAS